VHAAGELGGAAGDALFEAAATAFDAGVTVTALIGAALVVIAGVIAATTLGGSRQKS
jgi:DHA2 family multidrug resistance protein-like MFS transporter